MKSAPDQYHRWLLFSGRKGGERKSVRCLTHGFQSLSKVCFIIRCINRLGVVRDRPTEPQNALKYFCLSWGLAGRQWQSIPGDLLVEKKVPASCLRNHYGQNWSTMEVCGGGAGPSCQRRGGPSWLKALRPDQAFLKRRTVSPFRGSFHLRAQVLSQQEGGIPQDFVVGVWTYCVFIKLCTAWHYPVFLRMFETLLAIFPGQRYVCVIVTLSIMLHTSVLTWRPFCK